MEIKGWEICWADNGLGRGIEKGGLPELGYPVEDSKSENRKDAMQKDAMRLFQKRIKKIVRGVHEEMVVGCDSEERLNEGVSVLKRICRKYRSSQNQ
jgi:hypothetical protein